MTPCGADSSFKGHKYKQISGNGLMAELCVLALQRRTVEEGILQVFTIKK
jgi:hypothetical protein